MIKYFQTLKEKYLDDTIDLAKLSKSFLLWGCGVVLVYIGNVYLTRIIGINKYGEYAVFMNWVALGTAFITFGWDGFLVQKIPLLKEVDGKRRIGSLLKRIILSIAMLSTVLIGSLLIAYYSGVFHEGLSSLSYLLLLVIPITILTIAKSFLKAYNIILSVQWLEDLLKPLLLLAFFAWAYFSQYAVDLNTVYLINIGSFALLCIIICFIANSKLKNKLSVKEGEDKLQGWVRRCFYFLCIMLGYTFFSKMELLFLGYYNKNEDAGKYQLLLRIADLVILPDFLFNYYLPQKFAHLFAGKKREDAELLYKKAARVIFVLQVICLAGVAAVGYFYLKSFRVESTAMYLLLIILCSSQLFYSLFGSSNLVLMTSGNEKYSFLALAIVLVLEAIANIIWVPGFGLQAAVYISWGSVLLYTLILFSFVKKKLKFAAPMGV
jgi:O-antigen/teichoic acid export membrane protein